VSRSRSIVSRVLAALGPHGGLSQPWRWAFARATGFSQALTAEATIAPFVHGIGVTVPYGARSAELGLGAFPLALDGAAHTDARRLIADVLDESADAHTDAVRSAAALAAQIVGDAGPRFDLVSGLVRPVLRDWVERWYGLPEWGERLELAGCMAHHAIFLNPDRPNRRTDEASAHTAAAVIARTLHDLETELVAPRSAGTVSAALASRVSPELAARHLVGLTVGPLALGRIAVVQAIDVLVTDGWSTTASEHMFETALRRHPPLPGIPRLYGTSTDLPGIGRRRVRITSGTVLAATGAALAREDEPSTSLLFGHGPHACMGREQIGAVAAAIIDALSLRPPVARVGRARPEPPPRGMHSWPFPGRLELRLPAAR
jgi:cytochrome P450